MRDEPTQKPSAARPRSRRSAGSELFAKGATRLSALVEHEHQWAIDFWDSMSDLGYERDPKFARYIADRKDD